MTNVFALQELEQTVEAEHVSSDIKDSLFRKCSATSLLLSDEHCLTPMDMDGSSVSTTSIPLQPQHTRNPAENPVHGYPRLAHHMGHNRGSAIFRRFATLNVSIRSSHSSDVIRSSLRWRTKAGRWHGTELLRQRICYTCRRRSVTWSGNWSSLRRGARILISHISTEYRCYEAQTQPNNQECNGKRSWRLGIN